MHVKRTGIRNLILGFLSIIKAKKKKKKKKYNLLCNSYEISVKEMQV